MGSFTIQSSGGQRVSPVPADQIASLRRGTGGPDKFRAGGSQYRFSEQVFPPASITLPGLDAGKLDDLAPLLNLLREEFPEFAR